MLHNTNRRVKEYGRRHRFQSRWWRVLAAMACVVVFCTTYALILPAATLSQDTVCGLEEHTHSDECYAQELICTDESEEHEHSDTCYVSVLTCDLEEHQHSDDCYADDEEGATEVAGESATEADTADTETGKGSEGSGEGLTEDAEVDGSKDSAQRIEDSGEGLTEGSENSGEGLTEDAEIGGTENAAEGLTEDGVVDGEDAEETEELTLTEQTVEATVYTDDSYDDLYTENVTITVVGNLPEGVKVKAYPVNVTLDDETTVVEAYDITLFVPVEDEETGEVEENTYEPKDAVEVQIASDNLKDLEAVEIYHIPDGEDAQPEAVQSDLKDGEVKFSADSFSIYVVGSKDGTSLASISGDTTVAVGKTITLYCNSYGGGTSTWSSSDTSIATVTYSGSYCYVTGVKDGTVTITHTRGNNGGYGPNRQHSDTYTVTVGTPRENDEQAQIYALKTPTSTPRSNDTNQWTSYHGWNATVNMTGATWVDTVGDVVGKNVVDSPSSYIVSWPDNATGNSWTLTRDDATTGTAFSTLLDEIWDAYKSEIQKDLGITNLQKTDVTSITLTPYKISRSNGTTPDKHVDCTISVKSSKVYTAKFNVKEVGSTGYENVYSKNYKITDSIDSYTYNDGSKSYAIGDTKVVDGKTYRLTGWYIENSDGGARSDTIASFEYKPSDNELSDGAVNFYAEWVEVTNDLTIVKYEKGNESTLLSGAVFDLKQNDTVVKTSDATGTDGEVTITSISDGTFTVEETTAPTGYNKLGETISIKFNNGSLTLQGSAPDGVKIDDGKLYVPNEPNKVQVKKYDGSDNSALEGATFKLTSTTEGFTAQEVTTGANGLADFTKLPDGTYELEEIGTPAGYNGLGAKIKFSVSNGTVQQVETNTVGAVRDDSGIITIPNYKLATINVKKVDSKTSAALSGAEFTLQNSDSKYYKLAEGSVTWEESEIAFSTNTEGTVSFINVPDGTYTLKEFKAPANYTGISGSITITVKNGAVTYETGTTGAKEESGVLSVPNSQILVSFQLKKVDSADGSKVLPGASFTLSGPEGFTEQKQTTDASGLANFTNLPAGTYTLTETKAPDGYNILTETIIITVNNGTLTASNGDTVTGNATTGYTVTVKNSAGEKLPNTGGPGTTMYTLSGLMLMAIAAAGCLMYRGRMSGKGGAR